MPDFKPLEKITYSRFAGDFDSFNIVDLAAIFSDDGSVNSYVDRGGVIRRIKGYTAKNSAYTTNTGGSATKLAAVFPYRFFSGGSRTDYIVGIFDDGVDEWEIATSTDGAATFTFRKDMGSGAVGKVPHFAQFGNEGYITNGVDTPQQSADGTTWSNAGGTQSPQPTAALDGTVGKLTGGYEYKLVSVEVDKSRHPGSLTNLVAAAREAIQCSADKVDLSWTADADTDVVGYEIYRTEGDGTIFYFVAYVDGRTTISASDNMDDATLRSHNPLIKHGDAPPAVRYCAPFRSRMWWIGTDADPTKCWHSDPGDADSVGDNSFVDLKNEESGADENTGGLQFGDTLVVFQYRSIWTISGTGQLVNGVPDWPLRQSQSTTGTPSIRSVLKIPAGAKFRTADGGLVATSVESLMYVSQYGDVRLFDGKKDEVASASKSEYLSSLNLSKLNLAHAQISNSGKRVFIYFAHGSAQASVNKGLLWNTETGAMTELDTTPFGCSASTETSTDPDYLIAGSPLTATGGLVYQQWTGDDFNGSDITSRLVTNPIAGINQQTGESMEDFEKIFHEAAATFKATSGSRSVTLEWYAGYADISGASAFSTATLDTQGTNKTHVRSLVALKDSSGDLPVDRTLRLVVTDTGALSPWELHSIMVRFAMLEGEEAA